jgi:hypothetical protein
METSRPVLDYYVRLPEAALLATQLSHLGSGIDFHEGAEAVARRGADSEALSAIRGYTEWVSKSKPTVSVGWDWMLTGAQQLALDVHSVRTNVMLIDADGVDCGQQATVRAVIRLIGRCAWQAEVLQAL